MGNAFVRACVLAAVDVINFGFAVGLILGAMLLLRPLLCRALSPQQRVILWAMGWIPGCLISWYNVTTHIHILPFGFRDLITPRVSMELSNKAPAFLPGHYAQPGVYHVALPGDLVVPVELNDRIVSLVGLIWWAAVIFLFSYCIYRNMAVRRLAAGGEPLPKNHPLMDEVRRITWLGDKNVQIRMCSDIPTSFVFPGKVPGVRCVDFTICLQDSLSPQRLPLVVRHEANHIELRHCWLKSMAMMAVVLHWWNPFMWLAYRSFCRDMELACDRATLNKLDAGERREYAHTLVELAAGKQLWDVPLCLGESDAKQRVEAVVRWRPGVVWKTALQGVLVVLLSLFFIQGPTERVLPQDIPQFWANAGSGLTLIQGVEREILEVEAGSAQVRELWVVRDGEPTLFAQLEDGSWWKLLGYFRHNRQEGTRLYLSTADPVLGTPDLGGAVLLPEQ